MPILGVAGNVITRNKAQSNTGGKKYKKHKNKKNKVRKPQYRRYRSVKDSAFKPIKDDRVKDWHLYTLELTDNYYYIGISSNVANRYKQHSIGEGAQWTKVHHPLSIIETRHLGVMKESDAVRVETQVTIEYMRRFGVIRVRGGIFCSVSDYRHSTSYGKFTRKDAHLTRVDK